MTLGSLSPYGGGKVTSGGNIGDTKHTKYVTGGNRHIGTVVKTFKRVQSACAKIGAKVLHKAMENETCDREEEKQVSKNPYVKQNKTKNTKIK